MSDLPESLRQEQNLRVGDVNVDGQGHYLDFSLKQIIQISVDEIKQREFVASSPYKGLKRFELEDKDDFFGRDQFLKELVDELEKTNLILLLGASGSGKSSIVRAGLLPYLSREWKSRLVNFTFTPDQDPFESLYANLLSRYKQAEARIAREAKSETLTQVVTTLRQPESRWFLFIDQFEELFTTSQVAQRDRFIDGLVQLNTALKLLGSAKDCPVKIMATMRADFLDRLSPYPALVIATNQHRPIIAEMQQDELRLAIEQPAAQHGVVFETGLVEEIIKGVQGQAGYLPLLQYTLNLLWEHESQRSTLAQDRALHTQTYRDLGGVRGALQKHVDQIYGALTESEQVAAQRIFLKLVEIGGNEESGTEWKPVRRRAIRSEFQDVTEEQVLTRLVNENLLVSDRQRQAEESTLEIAHEILLTSWEMLNTWIKENRQAIALRNRLNDDVMRWQTKKPEDELWTGSKLEQILELRKDSTFNQVLGGFSSISNQFIDASLEKRDSFQKRERKRTRLIASLSITVACSSLLALLVGGIAWQETRQKQYLEVTRDGLIGNINPELIRILPDLMEEAIQLKNAGNYERSITFLKGIINFISQLNKIELKNIDLEKLEELEEQAKKLLTHTVIDRRISKIENAFQSIGTGKLRGDADLSYFENQFTDGALKETYKVLMLDIGADIDRSGIILSEEESIRMPCEVLKEIEHLWRSYTENRCGWYGSKDKLIAPECDDLYGISLTNSVFYYHKYVELQLDSCGFNINNEKIKNEKIKQTPE